MISMGVAVEQIAVKPTKSLKSIVTLSWLCASIDSPERCIQSGNRQERPIQQHGKRHQTRHTWKKNKKQKKIYLSIRWQKTSLNTNGGIDEPIRDSEQYITRHIIHLSFIFSHYLFSLFVISLEKSCAISPIPFWPGVFVCSHCLFSHRIER